MTPEHTHIVGAGIAGLSAALALTRQGGRVTLYDAAPQVGGRCRTIESLGGFSHDNGTHVLFAANRNAMRFLNEIDARSGWIEPEPGGIPICNLVTGDTRPVSLNPWSWTDPVLRPPGFRTRDLWRFFRLAFPAFDFSVAQHFAGSDAMESFIEPLAVAIFNTPVTEASSRRLGQAVRRLAFPGGGKLLVARDNLNADLVEPAHRTIENRQSRVKVVHRLRTLLIDKGRVSGLNFSHRTIPVGDNEAVVLALPPYEVATALPHLAVPTQFEPIVNVHYRTKGPTLPRMMGFSGGVAQWALLRSSHVSVTVSAAGKIVDCGADELALRIWHEIAPALKTLGLPVTAERMPDHRVVKERRATIRQAAGPLPQPPIRPLSNLVLAGDWIGTLPASIESAVVAGERAAAALGDSRWISASRPLLKPLTLEGVK